ncbi:MAG: arsenite methyltransferase [Candidatus Aenigmarchaeota archaeon]|nr:arsenite methyltransferase [Candidatus Aenigmarchaeota archaeon]
MEANKVKELVKNRYSELAKGTSCCSCKSCGSISESIGYSKEELNSLSQADMGLGCGNPTALGKIKEGDIVVDLGSGAGLDCFLAAKKVGKYGKVIGIDMTENMIEKARKNSIEYGFDNVEFRLGEIENIPLKDSSANVIISNCVINLSPNKDKVFSEAYRILKNNGKLFVSNIVLLEELSEEQINDENLLTGCVAGALLKDKYIQKIKNAGFDVKIIKENKSISKEQYNGIALESLGIEATKV